MRHIALTIALVWLGTHWLRAEDSYPIKVYPCPRLDAAPAIDGSLADACWAKAPVVSGFTRYDRPQLMGVQTSFRMGYDETHLYLGVHCDEPKAKQLAPSFAGRDSGEVFHAEAIELFLDPRHSHADYYQIAANLAGSLYDSFKTDPSWDSATRAAAKILADGWELEMAIPWRDIGVDAPKPGMVLGFNVCRDRHAGGDREWSNWSQTMASFHDPVRFAHLVLSPTEAAVGALEKEFRKGDRLGPILVFSTGGYAGKAYGAMAREMVRRLDALIAEVEAEGKKEAAASAREEVTARLQVAREEMEPVRRRLNAAEALDGAAWTRMSVELSALEAKLRALLWDARLAALLRGI